MANHPSITSLRCAVLMGLLGMGACGPLDEQGYYGPGGGTYGGGGGQGTTPTGDGRVAMSWTLNGMALTVASCQQLGIDFMQVEVDQADGPGSVAYTEVDCNLDKYSLDTTPTGNVVITVDGVQQGARGQTCTLVSGQATAVAGTAYPSVATAVPLLPVPANQQCQ